MGLKKLLLRTENPSRRCFIYILLTVAAAAVAIWDGARYDLKTDGPEICLENQAVLRKVFGEDTLTTMLNAGDSLKLLAIKKSSYGQNWLVRTRQGEVGWVDAADLGHIRQVLTDGRDKGDTVTIRADWSQGYVSNYIYTNGKGEECDRTTSDFIPVFEGWEDYVYNRGRIAGMCTREKFEESSVGKTCEELNEDYGQPTLVHATDSGFRVQYNWKALEPATGKMWKTNVTFGKDSVATAVDFTSPSDRAAGWLKVMPLAGAIVNSKLANLMVRGSQYEPMVFGNPTTKDYVIICCLLPLILLWGYLWVFCTGTLPVLVMGWLVRFPAVFKKLGDRTLLFLMLFVMLASCYVWSVALMAWGMFPVFSLFILVSGWYAFTLAKSPLCQFPHQRCPHCRRLFTIRYDRRELLKTHYEQGRDIIRGQKVGERTAKWKEWTEVTTTKTYKSGRQEVYKHKENERTMARDYKTYLYFDYDLTYKVDTYKRYYQCDKCGFVEDDTTCRYEEVDRKFAGTHTAELGGEAYHKPWYKR